MKKSILIAFISILGILNLASCYAARVDGPYKGRVIDADTGQPIEGVVVLGVWYTETPSAAGALHRFYDAMETVTDKNGDFEIKGLGLLVLGNVIPMDVLIFKAGYEYIGLGPWVSLKVDILLKQKIKWEEGRAIIPLKRVTVDERRRDALYPPIPPTEAPLSKVRRLLQEINKDLVLQGFDPMKTWGGDQI